jgi:hypothetical protein
VPLLLRILAVLLLLVGGLPVAAAGMSLQPGWPSPSSGRSGEEEHEERAAPATLARDVGEAEPTREEPASRATRTLLLSGRVTTPSSERGVRPERCAPLRC